MNSEHVTILRSGVPAWNVWRETTDVAPDLAKADLRDLDLSGINLAEANLFAASLSGGNLSGVDLRRANLEQACLAQANLSGADLYWAKLYDAWLTETDLTRADLTRAGFYRADLSRAVLHDADLHRADLSGTVVSHADLSGANLTWADLTDAVWHSVIAKGAVFQDALLRGFRTVDCDFTGAVCSRANYRWWLDRQPKWRVFAQGEFEWVYGQFHGLSLVADPEVGLVGVTGLAAELICRWQQTHPGSRIGLREVREEPYGVAALIQTEAGSAATVLSFIAEQIGGAILRGQALGDAMPQTLESGLLLVPIAAEGPMQHSRANSHYADDVGMNIELPQRIPDLGRLQYVRRRDLQLEHDPRLQTLPGLVSLSREAPLVAAISLGRFQDVVARELLLELLNHEDPGVRHEAALSLGDQGHPEAVPALIAALNDPASDPRWSACWALVGIWTEEAIAALRRVKGREMGDREMRDAIDKALKEHGRTLD